MYLVFPFQVWLSFAQFETSTAVEESIEQARLVEIIRLSNVNLLVELKMQCSRLMDYLPRKNEILVRGRKPYPVFLSDPSYVLV